MADPLAQAMVLTAIVITMGVSAFVLALGYRSFRLFTQDRVEDDPEDVKVASRRSPADEPDYDRTDDPETGEPTLLGDAFDAQGNPIPHRGVGEPRGHRVLRRVAHRREPDRRGG